MCNVLYETPSEAVSYGSSQTKSPEAPFLMTETQEQLRDQQCSPRWINANSHSVMLNFKSPPMKADKKRYHSQQHGTDCEHGSLITPHLRQESAHNKEYFETMYHTNHDTKTPMPSASPKATPNPVMTYIQFLFTCPGTLP